MSVQDLGISQPLERSDDTNVSEFILERFFRLDRGVKEVQEIRF